jgi:hypothetical protein
VEYTTNALNPRRTTDGESHHASRRDVWPNLPPFQTTSGAAIFPSAAEGPDSAFPPLGWHYSKILAVIGPGEFQIAWRALEEEVENFPAVIKDSHSSLQHHTGAVESTEFPATTD